MQKQFTPAAVERLKAYQWPGNIRQLRNLVEEMFIISPNQMIEPEELPEEYLPLEQKPEHKPKTLKEIVAEAERKAILEALSTCPDRQSAARRLGIDYSTLIRKIRRFGIV